MKPETKNKKTMRMKALLGIGLVHALVITAQANQEQLAKSLRETHVEVTQTAAQLRATMESLDALTKQKEGDLRPAYNAYCSEVAKTEAASKITSTRATWMSGDGRKYFVDWQKTVDGISNESLRKKAQKRLDAVAKSYGKVETQLVNARDKFAPFLSDLADVQKTLASDVTAGGVKAVRGTVKSANWNLQFVDQAIKSALKEMDKMAKALSPEAK